MINLPTEALIFSAQSLALALRLLRSFAPVSLVGAPAASSVFGCSGTPLTEFAAECKTR